MSLVMLSDWKMSFMFDVYDNDLVMEGLMLMKWVLF